MRTNSPSPVTAAALVIASLAVHGALLARFTDESLFLTPDFVDYLVGARSLASGQGYRDLSNPDLPMLTRPVGTSALLLPVVGSDGPFPLMECKRWFNALSMLLCVVAGWFSSRMFGGWHGLLACGLATLIPATTILGSNLYSEVPFTLFTLAAIGSLSGVDRIEGRARTAWIFAVAALFAFAAEKTRTMGIFLWPGLAIAAWTVRCRWTALGTVAIGVAASQAFEFLPIFAKSSTSHYADFFREIHGAQGIAAIAGSMLAAASAYLECFAAVICPILWPGLDWFGLEHRYLAPQPITLAMGGIAAAVCLWRCVGWIVHDRRAAGLAMTIYFAGAMAALLVWPRMARLAYPLYLPCVAIFWSSAAQSAARRLGTTAAVASGAFPLVVAAASAAVFWVEGRIPSGMWPQIKRAGELLAANPASGMRLATDAKDLYLVTRRPQRFINASSMVLEDLNRSLLQSGANHYGFVGRLSDPKIRNNPAYIFRPITAVGFGFSMLALEPNGAGAIRPENRKPAEAIAGEIDASSAVSRKKLLQESVQDSLVKLDGDGNLEAAIAAIASQLAGTRYSTPGATEGWLILGLLQLEARRPDEALLSFERASRCDYADVYAGTIAGGRESARAIKPLQAGSGLAADSSLACEIVERIAASLIATGRFQQAMEIAEWVLSRDASRLSSWAIRLLAARRIHGPDSQAELMAAAEKAIDACGADSRARQTQAIEDIRFQIVSARTLQLLKRFESGSFSAVGKKFEVRVDQPETWTGFAHLAEREGLPGVALETLTNAVESDRPLLKKIRDEPEIWWALAVLNDMYGRVERAQQCRRLAEALEKGK